MKIISYANPTSEGIVLRFEKPEKLSGTLECEEVWVSWDRISELLTKGGSVSDSPKPSTEELYGPWICMGCGKPIIGKHKCHE